MSKSLVIVANTPSPNTLRLRDSVKAGALSIESAELSISCLDPDKTVAEHVKAADGLILGTTENLGYMSGLVKDFFDRNYYSCLDHTQGLPLAIYIRAGHDGTGTLRAVKTIVTGLRWKLVHEPLILRGAFKESFVSDCNDLGMYMAASLDAGII